MKPTLVDSDIVSYYLNGNADIYGKIIDYMEEYRLLNISIITHYEVLWGLCHKNATRKIRYFENFLLRCEIINLTPESIEISARETARLKRQGITIGTGDMLIAGTALAQGFVLASNNERHFNHINNLEITNWKKE